MGGVATQAFAANDETAKRIKEFAGGKEPKTGKVSLTTPEIAETAIQFQYPLMSKAR